MILIGENIHIISSQVRNALENRDENFIKNLIKIQQNSDCIDLNVGPAKGKLDRIFEWLIPLCEGKNISLDSTNSQAISDGLKLSSNPKNCFINSTSKNPERLEPLTDLAFKYNCNLIALAMAQETGIPKTPDERLEIIFEIFEKCSEKGISENKIFFDPLVLPVKADQSQAIVVLDTIRIIKESLEGVKTVIGLSNISNGIPKELRSLMNRVFATLAYGAGLDAIIYDAKDNELVRVMKMLETGKATSDTDNLYLKLSDMIHNFGELEEIEFDKNKIEEQNIIKATAILLNKNIYSDSFTQV